MRVGRNFTFVDLSGFTALTEAEGDERAVAILTEFRRLVREVCSRRGVRVAKWLGDGAMLVSVEAELLLAATLEIRRAVGEADIPTPLRCGVSAGEVILFEGDDYIGHAVNVAARLCDMAPDGSVLVTESLVAHLPRWGVVLGTEETTVRGLERPFPISRVGFRRLTPKGVPDPVCGIPMDATVAEAKVRDRFGQTVLFCSESCRDTWERRPTPVGDAQGSPRMPLIGS
jgi:class 3 adenylate cyclase